MATADPEKLEQLLSEISTKSDAVQDMLNKMAIDISMISPEFAPVDNRTQGLLDLLESTSHPKC